MLEIFLAVFLLLIIYNFYWKRRNLPPGPLPLPLLGNMLAFKRLTMEKATTQWRKQYGDMYTIWLGETPIVLINDAKTILNTFQKDGDTYAGRPIDKAFEYGIVMTQGSLWRDQRRFALHVLRNFGLGRNLMQERVLFEVTALIDYVKKSLREGSENVKVDEIIDICVGSIINSLTFGYSFDKNASKEITKLKALANQVVSNFKNPIWRIIQMKPEFFKHLPGFSATYKRVFSERKELDDIFIQKIAAHKKKIDFEADEEPTDYVEAFLRRQHKLNQDGVTDHYFSDIQLLHSLIDIWMAGQKTTSITLSWMVLYMMEYPEIQSKAQEELDRVIGSDRLITLEDKTSLNYINAVVAETQRYANLLPLNIIHALTKDVVIRGYHLAKGSLITHQIGAVLSDETIFPEPGTFRPERFLDGTGKFIQPPELMPFGVGKRACLGEGLARLELFLFTANILNQFRISHPKEKKADMTRIHTASVHPNPFVTGVKQRY